MGLERSVYNNTGSYKKETELREEREGPEEEEEERRGEKKTQRKHRMEERRREKWKGLRGYGMEREKTGGRKRMTRE